MKIKHILALFIFGFLLTIIGALFKIMHWPNASDLLISGTLVKVLCGILLITKLLKSDKFKDFLNW